MKKLIRESFKALYFVLIGFLAYGTYSTNIHFRSQGSGYTIEAPSSGLVPDPCIFSIADFQELLNKIEPTNPIKVDGVLGKNTQAKWDRIYCNHMALKVDGKFYERERK